VAVALQQQGDFETAMATLEEAIVIAPSSAGAYYWLGHLHMRNGDRERAKEVLEQALAAGVKHIAVFRMRADIAAVEGDLDASVDFMERALALQPTDSNLLDRTAQLRAERQMFRTFLTDATAHFDSRYDPQNQTIVAALGDLNRDLESAWQEVVGVLGVQPQDRLLVIWLDAESYRWQAPEWSAALFDGRVRIVIEDYARQQESIRRTLRHELTHAVLHTMGAELPTWLHEGLAQSAEGRDAQAALASLPADGPAQALTDLVGNWTAWTDQGRVKEAYAYALSFCYWLRLEYGQSVMANLFLNLNGRTLDEAWSATFGMSLAATDTEFRTYLKTL
jgi:tetratricopeptide (TPR) repeat protein